MDDLISRQAAIDEIEYELEMINSALDSITLDFNARERLRQRRGEAREILNSIQQLPSAEPVVSEIVRCKDCKFCHKSPDWKYLQCFGISIWYCRNSRGVNLAETVGLNDYCSSAEKRTDESD